MHHIYDIGSRCNQKKNVTCNCKLGMKNTNFEIIHQHMNVTFQCNPWKRT
jgi:hypothetical protein